jgi:hypothetical protein
MEIEVLPLLLLQAHGVGNVLGSSPMWELALLTPEPFTNSLSPLPSTGAEESPLPQVLVSGPQEASGQGMHNSGSPIPNFLLPAFSQLLPQFSQATTPSTSTTIP